MAEHPIILFDGVCNLCNGSVQFIIRRDPKAVFRFAALQSGSGQDILTRFGLDPAKMHSIVLVMNNRVYERSRAILEIARRLSGAWPLAYVFIALPPFFRNWIYGIVAANRYTWFGKKDQCMIPTPELRERFLE